MTKSLHEAAEIALDALETHWSHPKHNAAMDVLRAALSASEQMESPSCSEPFYGHQFREAQRGLWICDCGQQLIERTEKCTNGTPSTCKQPLPAAKRDDMQTPGGGSVERAERGRSTTAENCHKSHEQTHDEWLAEHMRLVDELVAAAARESIQACKGEYANARAAIESHASARPAVDISSDAVKAVRPQFEHYHKAMSARPAASEQPLTDEQISEIIEWVKRAQK